MGILRLFFLVIFLLLSYSVALANDQTAASCSAAAIQTAIDNCISTGGGTVHLPVCSEDDTWTTNQSITKDTNTTWRLKGAGKTSTVFGYADNATKTSYGMRFEGTGLVEISDFTFRGAHGASGKIEGGIAVWNGFTTNLHVHHLSLERFAGTNGMLRICHNPNSPTVVNNCDFKDQSPLGGGSYGVLVVGRNREDQFIMPASFGTANTNATFIEGCTFDNVYHAVSAFAVSNIVFRWNTLTNLTSFLDGHGPCFDVGCAAGKPDGHNDGTYIYEIYNNSFTRNDWCISPRGGTFIVTDNSLTCSTGIYLQNESCAKGVDCTAGNNCPQSTTDPTKCFQTTDQVWIWNNTITGTLVEVRSADAACIRACGDGVEPTSADCEYKLAAKSGYTKSTCPHPLTELSGSCDVSQFGVAGYGTGVADTTPPTFTESSPSGTIACSPANPRTVTLSATLDEAGICRYSTTATTYDTMTDNFTGTGTTHTVDLSLACGASYTYHVRCKDYAGNEDTTAPITDIVFTIDPDYPVINYKGGSFDGGGGVVR